jgi:hypothetical protein
MARALKTVVAKNTLTTSTTISAIEITYRLETEVVIWFTCIESFLQEHIACIGHTVQLIIEEAAGKQLLQRGNLVLLIQVYWQLGSYIL